MRDKAVMSKRNSALVSKIKKLMQEDEDIGRLQQGTPAAVGEFFLKPSFQASAYLQGSASCYRSRSMEPVD